MDVLLSFSQVFSLGRPSRPELPSSNVPRKAHSRTYSQQTFVSLQTRKNPEGGSA